MPLKAWYLSHYHMHWQLIKANYSNQEKENFANKTKYYTFVYADKLT